MSKRTVFTTITPLPKEVTREIAVDTLHSHEEMIDLNPLVIERHPCKAPSFASAEEFHTVWYSIKGEEDEKCPLLPLASGATGLLHPQSFTVHDSSDFGPQENSSPRYPISCERRLIGKLLSH